MITLDIFLLGLLLISTLTGLVTEACKIILMEHNVTYHANTLAGLVAFFLSSSIGVGYIAWTSVGFMTHSIISLIALIVMSWLCAMVGYDKVIQAISQFKTHKGE